VLNEVALSLRPAAYAAVHAVALHCVARVETINDRYGRAVLYRRHRGRHCRQMVADPACLASAVDTGRKLVEFGAET
jgi:hypothetical protein